jgi:hypothetical protein
MVLKLGHLEKQIRNKCKHLNVVLENDGEDQLVRILRNSVDEDENIVHARKKNKANWIGYILRGNLLSKTRY